MSVEFDYNGLRYHTHSHVYAPHDDTWLLVDAVRALGNLEGTRVVEVGCGAGLGLLAAVRAGAQGVGTDRNLEALRLAQRNAELNGLGARSDFLQTDLLAGVNLEHVDHVLFNPPYLPTGPHERLPGDLNLAFDGGVTGNETLFRFAEWFAQLGLQRLPALTLVTSSLNDRPGIEARLRAAGYGPSHVLGEKGFPFERLYAERFGQR